MPFPSRGNSDQGVCLSEYSSVDPGTLVLPSAQAWMPGGPYTIHIHTHTHHSPSTAIQAGSKAEPCLGPPLPWAGQQEQGSPESLLCSIRCLLAAGVFQQWLEMGFLAGCWALRSLPSKVPVAPSLRSHLPDVGSALPISSACLHVMCPRPGALHLQLQNFRYPINLVIIINKEPISGPCGHRWGSFPLTGDSFSSRLRTACP